MADVKVKKCSKCGEEKSLDEFHKDKSRSLGVVPACKSCHAQYHKKRYTNPEVVEKSQKNNRQYKKDNKDKIKQSKELKRNTEQYKNKQKIKRARFKAANPNYSKERMRNKRKDPIFNMISRMRQAVCRAYQKTGISKNNPLLSHLKCSSDELYSHLVNSALKNYGFYLYDEKYHIDHIIPISIATTEDKIVELNHYTNLQLLYPEDNIKKSNKVPS
jgi:hypothetical protein